MFGRNHILKFDRCLVIFEIGYWFCSALGQVSATFLAFVSEILPSNMARHAWRCSFCNLQQLCSGSVIWIHLAKPTGLASQHFLEEF